MNQRMSHSGTHDPRDSILESSHTRAATKTSFGEFAARALGHPSKIRERIDSHRNNMRTTYESLGTSSCLLIFLEELKQHIRFLRGMPVARTSAVAESIRVPVLR